MYICSTDNFQTSCLFDDTLFTSKLDPLKLDDKLLDTNQVDLLHALPTGNAIYGLDGNDVMAGNEANDILFGNNGGDSIDGAAGHDLINGGSQKDTLNGGDVSDRLSPVINFDYLLSKVSQINKALVRASESIQAMRNNAWFAKPAPKPDTSPFELPEEVLLGGG